MIAQRLSDKKPRTIRRSQKSEIRSRKQGPGDQQPGRYDIMLMIPVIFLVLFGVLMVYSSSSAVALKKFGSDTYFLKRQIIFSVIGMIAMFLCIHTPLKLFRFMVYPFLLLALLLLIMIHIPGFGVSAGGAVRWLRVGPLTFQPAEFSRFALIIYLAYSISRKQDRIEDFYIGFLPHVIVLSVFAGLILLQPDFGSAVMLGIITWMMMFAGGAQIKHLAGSFMVFVPTAAVFMLTAEYRLKRLISFWDPWEHAADGGYQLIHSLMAFGSGGITGQGLGKSAQKLFYLPEPHTDFIFSVIGEEIGLIGVLLVLGLYALIVIKGMKIATDATDKFSSFLALGLTASIGLQGCVNMGVTLGLLPTKGLTLPFISYGGTSLLLNMVSVGLLIRVRGEG